MNHITDQFYQVNKGKEENFSAGFHKIFDSINFNGGVYCSDNLFTYDRNLSFLKDKKLMESFNIHSKGEYPLHGILWRTATIVWAAYNGLQVEGDFVECGCYTGTTARVVCDYLNFSKINNKKYYLYDLFEYNKDFSHHSMPKHSKELHNEVKNLFKDTKNAEIIKGELPNSLLQNCPNKIAFLHLDLNNAEAEIATLEILFDRMVTGAILILDDFGWVYYKDQNLKEQKWFSDRCYKVLEMPTGQGMVIKR